MSLRRGCLPTIFQWLVLQVQRGMRDFGNLVEGVGDGADEVFDAGAGGGGDGVEREIVFFAEGAEFVDASWVGGGVKF